MRGRTSENPVSGGCPEYSPMDAPEVRPRSARARWMSGSRRSVDVQESGRESVDVHKSGGCPHVRLGGCPHVRLTDVQNVRWWMPRGLKKPQKPTLSTCCEAPEAANDALVLSIKSPRRYAINRSDSRGTVLPRREAMGRRRSRSLHRKDLHPGLSFLTRAFIDQ